jgi:hypothetical protein
LLLARPSPFMSHDVGDRQHEALELQSMVSSPASSIHSAEAEDDGDEHTGDTMSGYQPVYSGKLDGQATEKLNQRTVRKLDYILLPFLALLFLFNSLDRSNVSLRSTLDA